MNAIATVSLIGPMAIAVGTLFYPKDAGAGSDQIPGRDISALIPGDTLSLPDAAALDHAADTNTPISLPVRGRMVLRDDGSLETLLVRNSVAGSVPVVRASLDLVTGYWSYTLPVIAGVPSQTILGRAPTVRFRESVGKRVKVELHHKQEISKGGDVYNVDNLNALTPKRHIDIHKGN